MSRINWVWSNSIIPEVKRIKVLVKEVYENSILVTGLTIPEGYELRSLYIRPDTNPPKFNKVTDCMITPERQLLFLEKSTKEFPIHKHVTVQFGIVYENPLYY